MDEDIKKRFRAYKKDEPTVSPKPKPIAPAAKIEPPAFLGPVEPLHAVSGPTQAQSNKKTKLSQKKRRSKAWIATFLLIVFLAIFAVALFLTS